MDLVQGKQFISGPCVREHSWKMPCTYSILNPAVLSSKEVVVVAMSPAWSDDRHMSRTRHNTRRHVAATAHVVMKLNTKHERHFLLTNIVAAVYFAFVAVVVVVVVVSAFNLKNLYVLCKTLKENINLVTCPI